MKTFRRLLLAVSLCAVPARAHADPVTITFDNPPCASLGGSHYAATCYSTEGVVISSLYQTRMAPLFTIKPAADAVTPPNVAQGAPDLGLFDWQLSFVVPASGGLLPGVTNFVSFDVTGSVRGQDAWQAIIYGSQGERLGQSPFGVANGLVTFSRPRADIARVLFGTGTFNQGFDNLRFNTPTTAPPVPEPATVLLLGGGLAAIVRRRSPLAAA